ncbi:MAG: CehA/McbA family metallohydrolase [Planctomycetota bacterium]|nr:CehA/McbA family metallohydrolase [Planctomycetota bacterium]
MHSPIALRTLVILLAGLAGTASAQDPEAVLELVHGVELQPFAAATGRLVEALELAGAPLSPEERAGIEAALAEEDPERALLAVQVVLDARCLVGVHISPESRVKVREGPAKKELLQQGWRTFLVKVHNEAGVTAHLRVTSPAGAAIVSSSKNLPEPPEGLRPSEVAARFLDLAQVTRPPLKPRLSGLALEYRVLQLCSRDAGKREATLAFDVGQGTQDLGFRNEVAVLFDCLPAVVVELGVEDHDGSPTTASFVIRDRAGRVYPTPSRRLAPDFFFHFQIYRADGETVLLPPGEYTVEYARGPEYRMGVRTITVPEGTGPEDTGRHREVFRLERWINTAAQGWISGDHHIHAAGCSHYDSPTQGVGPADMMRHLVGEDVGVGCVLSWGPCWYYQKQFFDGQVHELSTDEHVMRYDVEVSGFPSSHCGHLTLLGLTEDDYPGADRIEEWPTWDLPVLQWAKRQGAVTGFAHSGWGLQVPGDELPNYAMPPFDGIGANEYVVDVVFGAVDFISTVDTPVIWELNVWYHTLSCGFETRISGETDFPCIYGERVGLGRVYVKVGPGAIDFEEWLSGLQAGRSYVSDGRSHLLDFAVDGLPVGEIGGAIGGEAAEEAGSPSRLDLEEPATVVVTVRAAALLDPQPDPGLRDRPLDHKPYWHVERARIGDTRRVPVELIVNGRVAAVEEIEADGRVVSLRFEAEIERSSWIALRIFPTSHTNPVFVHVGGEPIRASRRSAQWLLDAVDVCWERKVRGIRESERDAARAAYDEARAVYRAILSECETD